MLRVYHLLFWQQDRPTTCRFGHAQDEISCLSGLTIEPQTTQIEETAASWFDEERRFIAFTLELVAELFD